MRKLIAVVALALAAFVGGPATAADMPEYPDFEIPDLPPVDYGLEGSFYLRGSAAGNFLWAKEIEYGCICVEITDGGYGYSFGAGFGYETGDGLRADVTIDYLNNTGLTATDGIVDYKLALRSTLGLINVYYDFGLGGGGHHGAEGGFGGYLGVGLGMAYNQTTVTGGCVCVDGSSVEGAAALMAGVTYDMGSLVADLGYRGIYMNKITNGDVTPYYINHAFTHEVRGTLRYRFN